MVQIIYNTSMELNYMNRTTARIIKSIPDIEFVTFNTLFTLQEAIDYLN